MIIVISILIVLLITISLRYLFFLRKVQALASKTQFSSANEDLMKISFEGTHPLSSIANDFNALVSKYQVLKKTTTFLEEESSEKKKLNNKVQEFEYFLDQSNLLSEIGRKITGSLKVEEILNLVYEYVRSSMDVEELELLYYKNESPINLSIDKHNNLTVYDTNLDEKRLHGMEWTLKNKKGFFLNNASEDYTQYFNSPVSTFSGKYPASVMGIPLYLNKKPIGAIGVFSMNKDSYTNYHLDFLKSIATYLAVALDNSNVYQLLESSKTEIEQEKQKSDNLLLNILPSEIAEELKEKGESPARHFDSVSILFTDFKEFTQVAEKLTATELVDEINTCFTAFDRICDKYHLEKIKTIGDSYMAVGGLPVPLENHAQNTVKAGIEMAQYILDRKNIKDNNVRAPFEMRLGIHCGPVVAGIVGVNKFQYDLWGDSVNTASRLESKGEIGKVNVSHAIYELLKNDDYFKFESRGKIEVKGKGAMEMYNVTKSNT